MAAGQRAWPAFESDEAIWRSTQPGRVPRRDRNLRYTRSIPPEIADLPVDLPGPVAAESEAASVELARLDADGRLDLAVVVLLRSEAWASSRIEQIEVGQRQVGRALAGFPSKRSAGQVAANVDAMVTAVRAARQDDDLTVDTFHRIHEALLPDEDGAGQVRDVQSWIGGSDYSPGDARYVPPPPEAVPGLLADLVAFCRRDDMPALAQAAIGHAQFESIHPYHDGNGRVGRALIHIVLARRGVVTRGVAPVSLALLADRDRYLYGLTRYGDGDAVAWTRQFASACNTAARAGRTLTARLADLRDEWERLPAVTGSREDATIRTLVPKLTANPVLDVRTTSELAGVSRPAARNALTTLEEAGVLRRRQVARNHPVWEAHEVFATVDSVEQDVLSGRL